VRRLGLVLMVLLLFACTGGEGGRAPSAPDGPAPPLAAGRPRFLVAAGDIACPPEEPVTATTCHHARTAALFERGGPLAGPEAVLLLGDVQYEVGAPGEYRSFDATWGRAIRGSGAMVLPVTGNHEYGVEDPAPPGCRLVAGSRHACGFAGYFAAHTDLLADGDADHAVTFGQDDRHPLVVIAVDVGACEVAPERCAAGGPVVAFLRRTLADASANPPRACTVVAWHQARWSELGHGDLEHVDAVWRALFDAPRAQRPDLVLNGHDHLYERYPRLDLRGRADPDGISQVVVGTGGREIAGAPSWFLSGLGELAAIDLEHFGVLHLAWDGARPELRSAFVTEDGERLDAARHACRT
jgi:calcineurin-like phosphoesterase family protein